MSRDDARLEDTLLGSTLKAVSFSLLPRPKTLLLPREPDPAIGKKEDDGPSLGRGSDRPLPG